MNKPLIIVGSVVALLAVGSAIRGASKGPADIEWQTSIPVNMAKPSLLYFTADWCPPCKTMKANAWPDDRVEAVIREQYIPVYIDIDQQPELAAKYGVESIPTIIVVQDADVVARGGFGDADMLLRFLQSHTPSQE